MHIARVRLIKTIYTLLLIINFKFQLIVCLGTALQHCLF